MNKNYEVFKQYSSTLIKEYKGMYVAIKNGVIYQPHKTYSEAFKSAYTGAADRFDVYWCVSDDELKRLSF